MKWDVEDLEIFLGKLWGGGDGQRKGWGPGGLLVSGIECFSAAAALPAGNTNRGRVLSFILKVFWMVLVLESIFWAFLVTLPYWRLYLGREVGWRVVHLRMLISGLGREAWGESQDVTG